MGDYLPAADSLKEYLVKLGWDIDELGLKKATDALGTFESKASSMGGKFISSFAAAGTAVGSFLLTANLGIAKLLDGVADADLATERWARKMWTTEEQARSFLTALDAMDASFEDVFYMTPEEFNNMRELQSLANSLKAPDELNETLKLIRDIGQEANKTKVIFNYATQWIAYYVGQYMGKEIKDIHDLWANFNDYLIEKLPYATERIAYFFTIVYKLGATAAETIGRLIEVIKELFDEMPDGAKKGVAAISGFLAILKTGPIGIFIAAVLALLLLLDDFYTWQRGGKSAFGDSWAKLTEWTQSIETDKVDDLKDSAYDLLETLWDLIDAVFDLGKELGDWAIESGALEAALWGIDEVLEGIHDLLEGITNFVKILRGDWDEVDDDSTLKKIAGPAVNEGGITGFAKSAWNGLLSILGIGAQNNSTTTGVEDYNDLLDRFGFVDDNNEVAYNSTDGGRATGGFSSSSTVNNDNRKSEQTNNIKVDIQNGNLSSYTPEQIANAIADSLNDWDPFK